MNGILTTIVHGNVYWIYNGYDQRHIKSNFSERPVNINKTSTYDVDSDRHKKSAGLNRLIGSQLTLMRD